MRLGGSRDGMGRDGMGRDGTEQRARSGRAAPGLGESTLPPPPARKRPRALQEAAAGSLAPAAR